MLKKILFIFAVFLLGVVSTSFYNYALTKEQGPSMNTGGFEFQSMPFSFEPREIASPKDRIPEDKILVSNERVLINIQGAEWASFTDTNSMDPVIDSESHAIEIIPQSADELQVGDIVAYESEYADGTIIHRIAYIGHDENGIYFVMKGDNNPTSDPGKVRFEQIRKVVVAIIY